MKLKERLGFLQNHSDVKLKAVYNRQKWYIAVESSI